MDKIKGFMGISAGINPFFLENNLIKNGFSGIKKKQFRRRFLQKNSCVFYQINYNGIEWV